MRKYEIHPDLAKVIERNKKAEERGYVVCRSDSGVVYEVEKEFAPFQRAREPNPHVSSWHKYYEFTDNRRYLFYRGRDITLKQVLYTKQVHYYTQETIELQSLGPWIESEENLPQGSIANIDRHSELFDGAHIPVWARIYIENSSVAGPLDFTCRSELDLKHCIVEGGLPHKSCIRYYQKILTPNEKKDRSPIFRRQGPETVWGFF